ncbi:MAG TPA: OsmC family protein [Cytophagales bacterium]|jgi:putative redox protein
MKIQIERLNNAVYLRATNEDGATLDIDGAPSVGGENKGFRPMQMLLAALGGCSTIDIVSILKKQRQPVDDISLTVEGEREPGVEPSLFRTIHVHFTLKGNLDEDKVRKAVELSMEKYCSVARTLEKTAAITYSFSVRKDQPAPTAAQ